MKTTSIQAFIICATLVFSVEGRVDQNAMAKKILDKISSFLVPKKAAAPRGPAGGSGPPGSVAATAVKGPLGLKATSRMAATAKKAVAPRGPAGRSGTPGSVAATAVKGPLGLKATSRVAATANGEPPNLDFLFVLDSSGSIKAKHFDKAKKAVQAQVDIIDLKSKISQSGTHVGLIEFSSPAKTHVEFTLRQYTSAAAIKAAVGKINYDKGSSTATADALRLAKKHFDQHGVRDNVKVLWVITDGQSNRGGNPKIPADELKNNEVEICVVGIGDRIDWDEIKDIALPDCYFDMESYEQMLQITVLARSMARKEAATKASQAKRAWTLAVNKAKTATVAKAKTATVAKAKTPPDAAALAKAAAAARAKALAKGRAIAISKAKAASTAIAKTFAKMNSMARQQ
ncbi:collagen alpha-1(VI) chain [Lingula anatina]|uniref:Collagen alpha-1(VI) chain n=1 Tax=Lingula anatina TaxID=7574 RepID=A0A1S3IBM8_LINAN|nr:collagen alpha-1(VI) chain [Lingula anatina]|eukprot:XP_013395662.1 collagen alpha-1(VI) chain [Lingula anatina]